MKPFAVKTSRYCSFLLYESLLALRFLPYRSVSLYHIIICSSCSFYVPFYPLGHSAALHYTTQQHSISHMHTHTGPILTHKATTFGGSSGAPLFKVTQGRPVVVGLHCGCVPPTGPPKLNGGMLISHILHHAFTGSFKEGWYGGHAQRQNWAAAKHLIFCSVRK